ncbi:unnamed protein product [Amoebophrya sp. A25]|nr:unnamed protein product [Amoebophrya sp. A25]|eukprot:GSA25T00012227001.1
MSSQEEESINFTVENDSVQWDDGYNNKVYVDLLTGNHVTEVLEGAGIEVEVDDSASKAVGLGGATSSILRKQTLAYIIRRVDKSIYCMGFAWGSISQLGPNLLGELLQAIVYASIVRTPGMPKRVVGFDGRWILNYGEETQIVQKIFNFNKIELELLRTIQQENPKSDWYRPVFSEPIRLPPGVSVEDAQKIKPFDPRTLGQYAAMRGITLDRGVDRTPFRSREEDGEITEARAATSDEEAPPVALILDGEARGDDDLELGPEDPEHLHEQILAMRRGRAAGILHPHNAQKRRKIASPSTAKEHAMPNEDDVDMFGNKSSSSSSVPGKTLVSLSLPEKDECWEVTSDQLRIGGDAGAYAVYRETHYGLETTPSIPGWLVNRVRLRRIIFVEQQVRACPDLRYDWKRRKTELQPVPLPNGKKKFITCDYYFFVSDHDEVQTESKKHQVRTEMMNGAPFDPQRGKLSSELPKGCHAFEDHIRYENIGPGKVAPQVHSAPSAKSLLSVPGRLQDIRCFTCRDLIDVPAAVRETCRVFDIEEFGNVNYFGLAPDVTKRTVLTGFALELQDKVNRVDMEHIIIYLRNHPRCILRCSTGIGISVAFGEILQRRHKLGVMHCSVANECFVHSVTLSASGEATRLHHDEHVRIASALSPMRQFSTAERKKIRLIQEVLYHQGKLTTFENCLKLAKDKIRNVPEIELRELARVARHDSLARLRYGVGPRVRDLGGFSTLETMRSGGITLIDTTFFTWLGYIYTIVGVHSVADGRSGFYLCGTKWKLDPVLNRAVRDKKITDEEAQKIRDGIALQLDDDLADRLMCGRGAPSKTDIAKVLYKSLDRKLIRRRIVADRGVENIALIDFSMIRKTGREITILPKGQKVHKLERMFLALKTALAKCLLIPECQLMPLQWLLHEIAEALANIPSAAYLGRTPNQTFWGLHEGVPEGFLHPLDAEVEYLRTTTSEGRLQHMTEARIAISSQITAMTTDLDYVKATRKIIANARAACRSSEEYQPGQQVLVYNPVTKTSKPGEIAARTRTQGQEPFEYLINLQRGSTVARAGVIQPSANFNCYLDIPTDLQPLTFPDFKISGRVHDAQRKWEELNRHSDEHDWHESTIHNPDNVGPFFSISTPGEGVQAHRRKLSRKNKSALEVIEEEGEVDEDDQVEEHAEDGDVDEESAEAQPPDDLDEQQAFVVEEDIQQAGYSEAITSAEQNVLDETEIILVGVSHQEGEKKEDDEADDEPNDESEQWKTHFRFPNRETRRALWKHLKDGKQGALKENDFIYQLIHKATLDGAACPVTPHSLELHQEWIPEEKCESLANPSLQQSVRVVWNAKSVAIVGNEDDYKRFGSGICLRFVFWVLDPKKSYPEHNLTSILENDTARHPDTVNRLQGATKCDDLDHQFIRSTTGLNRQKGYTAAIDKEFNSIFSEDLVEIYKDGDKCSKERVLTSRGIAGIKLVTKYHYKNTFRLCPGGHLSSIEASAESPTLSDLEFKLIISSLRQIRGRRLLRSGDVPRAFLKNLRFKEENRPRFSFPFNIVDEESLNMLKTKYNVDKKSIFTMKISLYGLREAALLWFRTLSQFLESIGFRSTPESPCVFRDRNRNKVGVHVDDLLYAGDEQGFKVLSEALKARFGLTSWSDAKTGFTYTGSQIKMSEDEQQAHIGMHQKIAEVRTSPIPECFDKKADPSTFEPLDAEGVGELKSKRGSLIYIGKSHSESTFPVRSLALGSDLKKDHRWTDEQNQIINRLKQHSPGTTIDLSYEEEYIIAFPDASGQTPAVESEVDTVFEVSDDEVRAFFRENNEDGILLGSTVENVFTALGHQSATRKREQRRKRVGAVTQPGNTEDEVVAKVQKLKPVLGYVILSVSKKDWDEYERKQKGLKRVSTQKEFDALETVELRCSFLDIDTIFSSLLSGSSYESELHAAAEVVPILEVTLLKLEGWGHPTQGLLLSDNKSAVMRITSKSGIGMADAVVFKVLAKLKSWYMSTNVEVGSITDRCNPGDTATKIQSGAKFQHYLEVLRGKLNLPIQQATVKRRTHTWEKPFTQATTEI